MGKETDVLTVQPREPTVAEATRDRAPPIRTDLQGSSVLVNNKEYKMLSGKMPLAETDATPCAYEFSDHDLPVHGGKEKFAIPEQEQQLVLDSIACVNEPLAIPSSSEELPNQVADPEAVGCEVKEMARRQRESENERQLEEIRGELKDPKVMDLLTRLLSYPNREKLYILPRDFDAASERVRQCGGGGRAGSGTSNQGSQTESSSSQGGQALVVGGLLGSGGGGSGGLGGAGGGDDPNDHRPFNLQPSHYNEHTVIEEKAETDDEVWRHVMSILEDDSVMFNTNNDPFFSRPQEEPLSASLDFTKHTDFPEAMDFDVAAFCCDPSDDLSQYLPSEPMVPVEPAEETTATCQPDPGLEELFLPPQMVVDQSQVQAVPQSVQQPLVVQLPRPQQIVQAQQPTEAIPMSEQTSGGVSSDIQASIELIRLMRPQVAQRPRLPGQALSLSDNVLSYSGVTASTPHQPPPSPAPSTHSSLMAPSPRPPPTPGNFPLPSPRPPPTPSTPGTPAPPTPASCQPCGPFLLDTFIQGDQRVCQLSISPEVTGEKKNMAVRAMMFINFFYDGVFNCAEQEVDLKVASDVHAKMCRCEFDDVPNLTVALRMPRDCKPLHQWLKRNTDLKDRLLVLQQVLNTIATIHTRGHEDKLSLWGSFMVWVARDMRVYLLVDFPMLLSKQQELQMRAQDGRFFDPRLLDVFAVREIYSNLVLPCIRKDNSWASPALGSALRSFEVCVSDERSVSRMAEAARILGEKRVCRVEVDAILPVVFFCLEREELQTALRELSCIVPAGMWVVQSAINPAIFMRRGDIVTADRRMQLRLSPCSHATDHRLLYIVSQPN